MAINETLKFSWGHIIAFLAIIFISYLSFMGLTYLTDGNFRIAGAGVAFIVIVLLSIFIGAQILKATDEKFKKKIIGERVLLLISPIVFVVLYLPQAHFWTVFDQRGDIESQFKTSVSQSKEMFALYEQYADNRITAYQKNISKTDRNTTSRANKLEALTLQLKSDNYFNLKNEAIAWIDKASGATVWNVFMIANIRTITEAIDNWNAQLVEMSTSVMSDEKAVAFDSDSSVVQSVKSGLSQLNDIYSVMKENKLYTWAIMFFLYLMLIFPYLIQDRHVKSVYTVVGKRDFTVNMNKRKSKKRESELKEKEDDELLSSSSHVQPVKEDDVCGPFEI